MVDATVRALVAEVVEVTKDLPMPVWQDKSPEQAGLFVLQSMVNKMFEIWLSQVLRWQSQPLLKHLAVGKEAKNKKFDFAVESRPGKFVVVEIQLANESRLSNDHAKFCSLHSSQALDLAVQVVLTKRTARNADSGLATFEAARDIWKNSDVPVLVLGLDIEGSHTVELSQIRGLTLPQMLGGKGGKGSHKVQAHVAAQLLDHISPDQVQLPQPHLHLIAAQERALVRKLGRTITWFIELAVKTRNRQALHLLRDILGHGMALLDKVAHTDAEEPNEASSSSKPQVVASSVRASSEQMLLFRHE